MLLDIALHIPLVLLLGLRRALGEICVVEIIVAPVGVHHLIERIGGVLDIVLSGSRIKIDTIGVGRLLFRDQIRSRKVLRGIVEPGHNEYATGK